MVAPSMRVFSIHCRESVPRRCENQVVNDTVGCWKRRVIRTVVRPLERRFLAMNFAKS